MRTLAVVLCLASVALCQDYKADVSKAADEIKSKLPDYVVEPIKGDWDGIKAPSFNVDPNKIADEIKNKVYDWAGDKASFYYVDPIKAEDVAESKVNDYDLEPLEPIEASAAEQVHEAGVSLANPAPAVEVGSAGTHTDSQYLGNNMNNYWQRLKELADKMKNSNGDESGDDSDESEDDSDDDSDENEGDNDDVESIEGDSNKDDNNNNGKNEDDSDESDEDDSESESDESDEDEKDGYNGFKFKIRLPVDELTQWIQAVKNAPADTLAAEDPEESNELNTFDDMIGEDIDMEEKDGKTVSFDDWLKSVDYKNDKYDALFRPTTTSYPNLIPDYLTYRKEQADAHENAHGSVEVDGRRRELYTAWHYIFFSFSGVLFLLGTVVMVGGIVRMQRYRRPNYILLAESGKVPL